MLSVEYASLHPAEGGCRVVQDLETFHVLAAQTGGLIDPVVATEVIEKTRAPTGHLSEKVQHFIFGTDAYSGNPEDCPGVLEAIRQQFPSYDCIPPGEIPREYIFIFGPRGAFRKPLQTMRKRKAFRSPDTRQRFPDGWAVMQNLFIQQDQVEGLTPAEDTGVRAAFRSWLDVVNYRVIVPSERTMLRRGGRADRRRWGDFG